VLGRARVKHGFITSLDCPLLLRGQEGVKLPHHLQLAFARGGVQQGGGCEPTVSSDVRAERVDQPSLAHPLDHLLQLASMDRPADLRWKRGGSAHRRSWSLGAAGATDFRWPHLQLLVRAALPLGAHTARRAAAMKSSAREPCNSRGCNSEPKVPLPQRTTDRSRPLAISENLAWRPRASS
jgi:hypothetical protein